MNISQPLLIEGQDWTCYFSPGDREKLVFKSSGTELLSVHGMAFGKFDESSSCCRKSKKHEAIDGLNSSFETVNVMPFGSEPAITRKCEISGNHASVTTDFDLRSRMEAGVFEVDNILVRGEWSRIGTLMVSSPVPMADEIRWHDAGARLSLELDGIPLILLFERADGTRLEIGSGDDLWRWLNTAAFPGSSQSVVIEKIKEGIYIRRRVAAWSSDAVIMARQYRFSWYFAWETSGMKFLGGDGNMPAAADAEIFTFPEGEVPQQLAACHGGRNLGVSCFHSPAVSGIFRSLIRSVLGSQKPRDLVIGNLVVPLCETAAHLERPQRQQLLHWNMTRFFDHWLWANKQLRNSGVSFYAIPAMDGKVFPLLPSVKGLSRIVGSK